MRSGFFSPLSACMAGMNMKGPASAWQPAKKSSPGTAGGLAPKAGPAMARFSSFNCPFFSPSAGNDPRFQASAGCPLGWVAMPGYIFPAKMSSPFFLGFFIVKSTSSHAPLWVYMYHILWWRMRVVRHIVFYFRYNHDIYPRGARWIYRSVLMKR